MATIEEGKEVGGYTLQRRIARGGMGEIWLAERKGISGFTKRVVVKTILEHFIEEDNLVDMFLAEGRIAADLSHPNIAQTFDLGQDGDVYYIVMEFVHGHDLRELLLTHYDLGQLIPLNLVLRIAAKVCDGLFYAHTWKTPEGIPAPIIHRDISPQNVLVTFDGNAKIVDFGIARAMHGASKTRSGVLKGKCAYMSPEQVHGQELDGRSDLFALGVVMFEMITGRRLFKRDSEMATLDAVVKGQVPPPSKLDASVPKQVEALVLKALDRKRDKRFADAREMQLVIDQVMQATGLVATSAHLSTYMHKIFSEDVEVNRLRLREAKRRGAVVPGLEDDSPALERSKPFLAANSLGAAPTAATESPTRNLVGGRRLGSPPGRGPGFWVGLGLLVVGLAACAWLLIDWLGETPQSTSDVLDAGGPVPGDPVGEAVSGPDAGPGGGDPDLQALPADRPAGDTGPGKRSKRKRRPKDDPVTGDKPLDIMMER